MTDNKEEATAKEMLERARLVQGERSGASPVVIGDTDARTSIYSDEPNKSWPMVIYILPNGDVLCRRELVHAEGVPYASVHLGQRSAMILKVLPEIPPGNSGSGSPMHFQVLKFRGDMSEFMQSLTKAFFATPGNEEVLTEKMFPDQLRHKGASENFLGHLEDDDK